MAAHSTAEDTHLARSAKMLCFPPALLRERACALLCPLSREPPPSPLTSMALLEAAAAAAAEPGAHTSGSDVVGAVLEVAAALGHGLFGLFAHPAPRVADGAAVLMRAIAGWAGRGLWGWGWGLRCMGRGREASRSC
jgi:hypothetical protein